MSGDHIDLTHNQELVLRALTAKGKPMSAYAILADLQDEGLKAPLQVYRALDRLIAHGLVHRLESLNAFVACATPHSHGTAPIVFTICEGCGTVTERPDSAIGKRIAAICDLEGFHAERETLEIHGECAHCAESAPHLHR
ncbi:MAG: transcriptional repressor [Bauldia sp.]|nr:transcriptional repressor [Bauldia sp.]